MLHRFLSKLKCVLVQLLYGCPGLLIHASLRMPVILRGVDEDPPVHYWLLCWICRLLLPLLPHSLSLIWLLNTGCWTCLLCPVHLHRNGLGTLLARWYKLLA